MICTFFGHKDAPRNINKVLYETIERLIIQEGVKTFYVGNNGNFDKTVTVVLTSLKQKYSDINCFTILAYLPKASDTFIFDTLYPEGLENVPYKYAISKRNEWMVNNSDYVITYVMYDIGGAAKFKTLAEKRNKTVINLA